MRNEEVKKMIFNAAISITSGMLDDILFDHICRDKERMKQGYEDAMKLYRDEILKAIQAIPIQFVVPENYKLVPENSTQQDAQCQ